MNDKIKELIKSLGIIPEDEHYEVAELIVQECAGVAWGIYANQEIANGIKQHFGVE